MSICCTSTLNLGCFGHCEQINTGINATITGEYTLKAFFLGAIVTQVVEYTIGEEIVIPNIYNENTTVTFKITDPNGDEVTELGNDCFAATIYIQNNQ